MEHVKSITALNVIHAYKLYHERILLQKERNDYYRSVPFASFSIDDIRLKSVVYRDMRRVWVAASRGKLT